MRCVSLVEVRENIDRIDDEIVRLIAERGEYVAQAAAFKKSEKGVRDSSRVEAVIEKVKNKSLQYGADPKLIEAVYREMISRFVSAELSAFKGESI